jgi:LmbE family N-acetylglucosaminyl deacetylase
LKCPTADHIYLSPHLDDVVLSCGGLIARQVQSGESVAAITVFSGSPSTERLSPFAQMLHARWQASVPTEVDVSDPYLMRREEDRQAFLAISPAITVIHLDLLDCIYRTNQAGEWLYTSETAIFGEVDPDDPALEQLNALPPFPDDARLYIPLTVGNHVDHQVVRRVVEQWGLPEDRIFYYEDYPYAARAGSVEACLDGEMWAERVIPLSDEAVAAKIRGIAAYRSQISSFWPTHQAMVEAISAFAEQRGGEILRTKLARNARR